jgi:hypothetical protein
MDPSYKNSRPFAHLMTLVTGMQWVPHSLMTDAAVRFLKPYPLHDGMPCMSQGLKSMLPNTFLF